MCLGRGCGVMYAALVVFKFVLICDGGLSDPLILSSSVLGKKEAEVRCRGVDAFLFQVRRP